MQIHKYLSHIHTFVLVFPSSNSPLNYSLFASSSLLVQPGVITLGTTFTLDRNLSAFMPYNVQVAAYNRYTVSKASFMYNSTTGVVAIYGPLVDIMTSEGGKGSSQMGSVVLLII